MQPANPSGDSQARALAEIAQAIQRLNKACDQRHGLSITQWLVLRALVDRPAASPFVLAAALDIHPSTLTPMLARLEGKGFVFVAEDPRNLRRKMISITREGRRALGAASDGISALLRANAAQSRRLHAVRDWLNAIPG
ncbi:MAG: MarR family transcriptional regulator [Verrucomicrobium sp.]|nr:MarR family transcriptional regulator [Verrucomicrobium sp.]